MSYKENNPPHVGQQSQQAAFKRWETWRNRQIGILLAMLGAGLRWKGTKPGHAERRLQQLRSDR